MKHFRRDQVGYVLVRLPLMLIGRHLTLERTDYLPGQLCERHSRPTNLLSLLQVCRFPTCSRQ
jgi:hypothetical protein